MTPVEFRGDLWHQKTRVPVVSCGVICVILCFAVLVEHRLVTDGHRHRHRPMASEGPSGGSRAAAAGSRRLPRSSSVAGVGRLLALGMYFRYDYTSS